MTEAEWQNCEDAQKMLEWLRESGKASERKLRLFSVACCRGVWSLLATWATRRAVEVAERYADGAAGEEELASEAYGLRSDARQRGASAAQQAAGASVWLDPLSASSYSAVAAACGVRESIPAGAARRRFAALSEAVDAERATHCGVLRDLFGSLPFREIHIAPAWLAWNDGTVRRLAAAIYEERALPSGHLDTARLAVLADALEESGCTDAELLAHLRSSGPHVRGCFALDAVLGKS